MFAAHPSSRKLKREEMKCTRQLKSLVHVPEMSPFAIEVKASIISQVDFRNTLIPYAICSRRNWPGWKVLTVNFWQVPKRGTKSKISRMAEPCLE